MACTQMYSTVGYMKVCVQALTSLICEEKLMLDGKEVKYPYRVPRQVFRRISRGRIHGTYCHIRVFYDRDIVEERVRNNSH